MSDGSNYYDEVISQMGQPEALLIFGPGEAKLQLRERVSSSKVLPELAVEIESTDKLTDLSETKHRQEPRLLVPRLF